MPQTRRSNTRQAPNQPSNPSQSRDAPRKRAALPVGRGSKRRRPSGFPSNNVENENDSTEPAGGGPAEVSGGGADEDWEDEDRPRDQSPEMEDPLDDLTIENYHKFTKDWTLGRIWVELKRRRDLNWKITPQEAHDEGVLIVRESERRIAALALAARVSEYTLKKSM